MQLIKIHEDDRGEISILKNLLTLPEVTIFKTKARYARGGCIHPFSDEYCCVVEGTILYTIGENRAVYQKGASVFIPKNTPHYFESLQDSIVLEWGATSEEKKNKHASYRKIVDCINAGVHSK